MADHLPKGRQRMDGIKNAAQKRHRHNGEILKRRELIKFLRPQTANQTQGPHERGTHECKNQHPHRLRNADRNKKSRYRQHPQGHYHPAHHRGSHIGQKPVAVGQRREHQKHQIAHHLAGNQRGRAVRKSVLQQAHHGQTRHEKGGVAHVVVHLHMVLQGMAEYQQIQHGIEHRAANRLEGDLPKSQHLFVDQGLQAGHA